MIGAGPSRVSQPAARQAATGRPQIAPTPPEEAPRSAPEPVQHHTAHRASAPKKRASWLKWLIIAVVVLVLAVVGWLFWSSQNSGAIDKDKYQAVFFTNGQVYFGKLQNTSGDYLRLTDVYYLQAPSGEDEATNPQEQERSSADSNVQLIKLGSEIHGPEDEMLIAKSQILFYENLKTDGRVSESIAEHKAGS